MLSWVLVPGLDLGRVHDRLPVLMPFRDHSSQIEKKDEKAIRRSRGKPATHYSQPSLPDREK